MFTWIANYYSSPCCTGQMHRQCYGEDKRKWEHCWGKGRKYGSHKIVKYLLASQFELTFMNVVILLHEKWQCRSMSTYDLWKCLTVCSNTFMKRCWKQLFVLLWANGIINYFKKKICVCQYPSLLSQHSVTDTRILNQLNTSALHLISLWPILILSSYLHLEVSSLG
jgi:hypothetical protein